MADRRAKSNGRANTRRHLPQEDAGTPLRRYLLLAAVCVLAAAVIVFVVVSVMPPDESGRRPRGDLAPRESPVERSEVVLPTTPAPATVEELKEEARQAAEEILSRFPGSPEAHHVMALLQKSLRQTDDAAKYWRECLQLAPHHVRARVGLARVAIDQGNDEAAVETLEEGLAAGCSAADIYHTLGKSLMNLGKFPEAADVLQKGLTAFPHSPEIWMLLGQSQIHGAEFQQAETSLRKAIELAPNYTDAHYGLATACARQGKREQAAEYRKRFGELKARDRQLEDRLALTPDVDMMRQRTAATLCGAGSICLEEGDRSEAERLLLRAAAIAPGIPETYKVLASLYQSLGRIADALIVQRRLVQLEPQNTVNYVNLAGLSVRLGDLATAEKTLQQAIAVRPDAAMAYFCLARLYLETGNPRQACSAAREAVRLEATPAGYLLLASACRQLNDTAGAEAAAAEARKLAANAPRRESVEQGRP